MLAQVDIGFNKLSGKMPTEFPLAWIKKQQAQQGFSVLALDHNELTGPLPNALCNLTQVYAVDNCMLMGNKFDGKCPAGCNGLPFNAAPAKLMKCFYEDCYAQCENTEDDSPCWHADIKHLDAKCAGTCVEHCQSACPPTPCTTLPDKGKPAAQCPKPPALRLR